MLLKIYSSIPFFYSNGKKIFQTGEGVFPSDMNSLAASQSQRDLTAALHQDNVDLKTKVERLETENVHLIQGLKEIRQQIEGGAHGTVKTPALETLLAVSLSFTRVILTVIPLLVPPDSFFNHSILTEGRGERQNHYFFILLDLEGVLSKEGILWGACVLTGVGLAIEKNPV